MFKSFFFVSHIQSLILCICVADWKYHDEWNKIVRAVEVSSVEHALRLVICLSVTIVNYKGQLKTHFTMSGQRAIHHRVKIHYQEITWLVALPVWVTVLISQCWDAPQPPLRLFPALQATLERIWARAFSCCLGFYMPESAYAWDICPNRGA